MSLHTRKSHFLGVKLRALRKRNGLTLEELSARCIQLDSQSAPSVSYLSMIESGKRVPSEDVLGLLSSLFQREPRWFLDGNPETEPAAPGQRGGRPARTRVPVFEGPAAGGDPRVAGADRHHRAAVRASADSLASGNVPQRFSRPRAIGGKRRRAKIPARR